MFADWTNTASHVKRSMGALGKAHPKMLAAYQSLGAAAAEGNALDAKTRELISLAVAVTTRCDGCISVHAQAAVANGATEAEVAQALATAIALNAGSAYVYSLHALEAVQAFEPSDATQA